VTRSQILYSGFKWDHHDERAGYQNVVAAESDYVDGGRLWGSKSEIGSRRRRINFLLIDICTVLRAWRYKAVLLFYPEQTGYVSAPLLRLMGKKVIYVLHLGEDYWIERNDSWFLELKRFNLRFVNRFIVLTAQQKIVFGELFPGRVVTIPHGVCSAPLPEPITPNAKNIAVVGDRYRDYDLLGRIIVAFKERHPEVKFHLVGMKFEKLNGAERLDNVVCHLRLSAEAYLSVLNQSALLLLPLTFATANNALLEGLLAGVPVICNDVPGVVEYLPGPEFVFDSIEDAIVKYENIIARSPEEVASYARQFNQYVRSHYSWEVIRKRVIDYCVS
jgi:glycosyltransferase involved in cell wall biosynthesis